MACNNISTLLGFEDEVITEKHKHYLNFTTNKLGGKPDLPSSLKLETHLCSLCQLPRPLVLQIYAPLENSTYHRTLYIYACINPNCWNHNESWLCIRMQSLEQVQHIEETTSTNTTQINTSATDWCKDADDWADDNNLNANEENGNVISNIQEKGSDEDDESCSFEETMRAGFENLNVDEKNANCAEGGAVGSLNSPTPTAEIEGNEGEVISIDTPTFPLNDITSLLHEVSPLPQNLCNSDKSLNMEFVSRFLSVTEESSSNVVSDRHVRELLQEYKVNNEGDCNLENFDEGASKQAFGEITENYEKSTPHHGDKMFHYFLSKIQLNPGQILRYSRGTTPLLLYPVQSIPKKCEFCQGEMVFEFQILPTLIPKLKLCDDPRQITRLEFGNVLIFTCRKSCWSTDVIIREESVIVQAEVI